MENVDEIMLRYYKAHFKLSDLLKGDWSKAELLIKNNGQAKQAFDEMMKAFSDLEQSTSAGKLYYVSNDFDFLFSKMSEMINTKSNEAYVAGFLEHIREEWEWKTEEGHVEDLGIVDALDNFFSLPNYDPDAWLKRSFLIRGVRVSSSIKIPKKIEIGFSEACASFIYGQNLSCSALARSVLEAALKDKYVFFKNMTLGEIIKDGWFKVDQLKRHLELNEKSEKIRSAGNEALHEHGDNRVRQLINESNIIVILNNLKEILEYLYE